MIPGDPISTFYFGQLLPRTAVFCLVFFFFFFFSGQRFMQTINALLVLGS